MVSKALFIVLIACTAVIASPVNRGDENAVAPKEPSSFLEVLKSLFGSLLREFFKVIAEPLKNVFNKISERLESEEFHQGVAELQEIAKVIYDENGELVGDDETKELVKVQLEKVEAEFEKVFEEAIESMKENSNKTVDATAFKNAVDELKQLVDKLYH